VSLKRQFEINFVDQHDEFESRQSVGAATTAATTAAGSTGIGCHLARALPLVMLVQLLAQALRVALGFWEGISEALHAHVPGLFVGQACAAAILELYGLSR
jgi:hypothetical protein